MKKHSPSRCRFLHSTTVLAAETFVSYYHTADAEEMVQAKSSPTVLGNMAIDMRHVG